MPLSSSAIAIQASFDIRVDTAIPFRSYDFIKAEFDDNSVFGGNSFLIPLRIIVKCSDPLSLKSDAPTDFYFLVGDSATISLKDMLDGECSLI